MSVVIAGAFVVAIVGVWFVLNTSRSRKIAAMRAKRSAVRKDLTSFAQHATAENSIAEIVALAAQVATNSFGAHRFVLLQEMENGWVASQPIGPPPPPVPGTLRGLFGWFKHNPHIASEADLGKKRFGAMRAPLQVLIDTYAVDVVMPLVHGDGLLAVVGMAIDRKPTFLDRELLRIFRLEVTAACANVRLHHQASHLFSLSEEVDMANSIELAMVPSEASGALGTLSWAGHHVAAGKASSDFWGVYGLEDGKLMLVVGDAVGKDLAGTMVSAVLKSGCDQIFAQGLRGLDPGHLLRILNDSLFKPTRPALASCSAVLFDPAQGLVHYANAGHVPPYVMIQAPNGMAVSVLKGTGTLLGDLPQPEYLVQSVPMSPGMSFIFLTDGLVAPRDDAGEAFGYRRFQRLLRRQLSTAPDALREVILTAISAHSAEDRPRDDQVMVVLNCQ